MAEQRMSIVSYKVIVNIVGDVTGLYDDTLQPGNNTHNDSINNSINKYKNI